MRRTEMMPWQCRMSWWRKVLAWLLWNAGDLIERVGKRLG